MDGRRFFTLIAKTHIMPQIISTIIQTFLNRPVFSVVGHGMNDPCRRASFVKLFSLKNIIFIGFAVAVIPLFVAVLYAAFAMRETASLGSSLNRQVFDQTKTIRLVMQKSTDIERKVRLFVLLYDPALRRPDERQAYENARASLKQALDGLLKLNLDNTIALRAAELAAKERLIYEQIIGSETENALKLPIDEAFQGLREASNTLSREFERHVEQQFDGLHQQSASLERGLLVKGTILLLVSLGFMAGLLTMLTRSIRQLDAAIRTLGSGNRVDPITVTGPCDLRELGERLEWLRTRLLELEASKYRLMDTVAGEIEKPLEAIVELAARLAEDVGGDFDPQRLDTALRLSANVESLQTVSAQLSRFSQINPDSQGASKETVNMKALLESVIEEYQTRFQAKSLTVKALLRPVEVFGIAEQLHAVVDHLLSNAVKYSPEGGEIRVLLRTSGVLMELEVEDEGPGFDADQRAQAFQPVFCGKAAESSESSHSEGSRLCLAMLGEYVANHQGRVEIIESRQDMHGARIRVQLPLMDST